MRIRLGELRRLIRSTILEYGSAASGVDPKDAKGFYPYELERGVDVQSYWYRSPGRGMGGDGDPGRPSDAADYIGMSPESTGESSEGGAPAAGDKKPAASPPATSAPEKSVTSLKK